MYIFRVILFILAALSVIEVALKQNLTRKAKYLAERLIANFGTNVLTFVEVGAKMEQEVYVQSNIINTQSESLSEYKAAVAGGFMAGTFGASMSASYSYSTDKRINDTLSKATRHSQIKTFGGPTVNRLLAQTFTAAKPAEPVSGKDPQI